MYKIIFSGGPLDPASTRCGSSKFIVRQMHGFIEKFQNISELKTRITTMFADDVSEIASVGYFDGKQKRWLCNEQDLQAMYNRYRSGSSEISLWCDRVVESAKRPTKRERHEEEVNDIFDELKEKHKDYDVPNLRLWARMIANGVHESTEEPPNVPMITGVPPKKRFKTESVHDVVVDAAKAIAQVFTVPQKGEQKDQSPAKGNLNSSCNSVNISPSRLADVRMKHYEQLRYIHKLYDDGILNDEEFGEQKLKILQVLRSL